MLIGGYYLLLHTEKPDIPELKRIIEEKKQTKT
jgi:hypothetical protein